MPPVGQPRPALRRERRKNSSGAARRRRLGDQPTARRRVGPDWSTARRPSPRATGATSRRWQTVASRASSAGTPSILVYHYDGPAFKPRPVRSAGASRPGARASVRGLQRDHQTQYPARAGRPARRREPGQRMAEVAERGLPFAGRGPAVRLPRRDPRRLRPTGITATSTPSAPTVRPAPPTTTTDKSSTHR